MDKMTLNQISDFSNLLSKLPSKKNTDQENLNRNLENLNKTILTLAKKMMPLAGLGTFIADIAMHRKTHGTFGENLKQKFVGTGDQSLKQKFGTMRGILNTVGIVKKGTGGILDSMLERREAKAQYIKDQLLVNPNMENTAANRKIFGKKFETQQKIQKELTPIQNKIKQLQENGFTDKQIARSGLTKKRDDLAAKLVASDNRLYDLVKKPKKEPLGEESDSKEETIEDNKSQEKTRESQNSMATDVSEIRKILENKFGESATEEEPEKSGWFGKLLAGFGLFLLDKFTGLFDILKNGLSSLLSPILNFLSKAGGVAVNAVKTVASKGVELAKNVASKITPGAVGRLALGAAPLAAMAYVTKEVADTSKDKSRLSTISKITNKLNNILGIDPDKKQREWRAAKDKELGIEPTKPTQSPQVKKPTKTNKELIDQVKKSSEKNEEIKSNKTIPLNNQTVISSPTTVNNKTTNNHISRMSPRSTEPTVNNYFSNRYVR